jgi:glycosyltransferase involved in cell wall biosynthesis
VRVIPNGVDAERFRPDAAARRAIRDELGIADDAPVFSIVAALRPEKNHRLFVEAAALVRNECAAARFLIVGDGPERAAIEKAARDAQLGDSLLMLGTRGDVPQVLAASDGFVLTSHNEANPVSILEAMSTGLPVVATRVGSVAESVEDEITGFLVSPGDAQTIARHCVALARDPSMRREMGGTARERVIRHWSLDAMVSGYQKLIADVYQSKSDRSRLLATAHRYADEVTAAR